MERKNPGFVEFPKRSIRNGPVHIFESNGKVYDTFRIIDMEGKNMTMPFDMKRFAYRGFDVVVGFDG